MNIQTKYLGQINISPNKILTFPKGLPAFEKCREYVLLDLPNNDAFYCLQSTQKVEVAFLLINPWDFFPDYDIHIPQEDLEELSITKPEQVTLYNIITIPKDPSQITANLMGPIVINNEILKGKQIILHEENYHTKHPLLDKKKAVESC